MPDRAELRRTARLLGWRGSKAGRLGQINPAVQAALKEKVRDKLQEQKEEEE